MKLAVERVSEK